MKAVVFRARHGTVSVEEMPAPQLRDGFVLIRNEFSVISAGTERAKLVTGQQSLIGKARSRPDQVKAVVQAARQTGLRETYDLVKERLDAPGLMGYSCAGVVLDVGSGVGDLAPGRRVAAAGAGYANHAEIVCVPKNLCAPVPDGVESKWAAFATVGAIALHGIHQAGVQPGSRVAVVGLGLVGQLAVRLLAAYGHDVVGIDPDATVVEMARGAGVAAFSRDEPDVSSRIRAGWGDRGADAVVVSAATKSPDPIELAGEIARERATVVVVGDVNVEPPRPPYYGKELSIVYSRSYGPGRYDPSFEERGGEYPEGFVPWTEQRNLGEFLRLLASGRLHLEGLSPVVFRVERAAEAYDLLKAEGQERRVAILLSYEPAAAAESSSAIRLAPARAKTGGARVRIAAVGAGSFPTRMLFPHLKRDERVAFSWITTASGLTARSQGDRWGFEEAVAGLDPGLERADTDCVMVLSRHDTHARYAAAVLSAGRALFCEKPLALSEEELESVAAAWVGSGAAAMVGFNRRFAPALVRLKKAIGSRGPIQVQYRVFAGKLPAGHWYFDRSQGGRIHGEACHFVDTAGDLVGARPVAVAAVSPDGRDPVSAQSVSAVVEYADGSTASIVYGGRTAPGAPKELIEVAAEGLAARIEDFESLTIWTGETERQSFKGAAKGHAEEMAALVDAVVGRADPIPGFARSLWSTLVTCRVADAVARGERVPVEPETPALRAVLLERTP